MGALYGHARTSRAGTHHVPGPCHLGRTGGVSPDPARCPTTGAGSMAAGPSGIVSSVTPALEPVLAARRGDGRPVTVGTARHSTVCARAPAHCTPRGCGKQPPGAAAPLVAVHYPYWGVVGVSAGARRLRGCGASIGYFSPLAYSTPRSQAVLLGPTPGASHRVRMRAVVLRSPPALGPVLAARRGPLRLSPCSQRVGETAGHRPHPPSGAWVRAAHYSYQGVPPKKTER